MSANHAPLFKWAMLTVPKICLSRQGLAEFGLELVVGRPEGQIRQNNAWGWSTENLLQISHFRPTSAFGRPEGGP